MATSRSTRPVCVLVVLHRYLDRLPEHIRTGGKQYLHKSVPRLCSSAQSGCALCWLVAAFLSGSLQEELYLTPVPGHLSQGGTCLRLHKANHGLKQAAAQWYGAVFNCLLRLGFVALEADSCFFRGLQDGQITLMILYVDDVAVAGSATDTQDTIKQLGMAFEIEDRGTIDGGSLLGMQVSRNWEERTILINQRPYIEQLVEQFGLINSAPLRAATPMEKGLQLSTPKGQPTSAPYLELFGALNYLSVISRPDIIFAVGALGRFNSCPSEQHWYCLKHVLPGTHALFANLYA